MELLSKRELHGLNPVAIPCNMQSSSQFEMQLHKVPRQATCLEKAKLALLVLAPWLFPPGQSREKLEAGSLDHLALEETTSLVLLGIGVLHHLAGGLPTGPLCPPGPSELPPTLAGPPNHGNCSPLLSCSLTLFSVS